MKRVFYAAVIFALVAAVSIGLNLFMLVQIKEQQAILVNCTTPGPNPPPVTGNVCYDRTAAAVGEIGNAIFCANLYPLRPPACDKITAQLDALQARP